MKKLYFLIPAVLLIVFYFVWTYKEPTAGQLKIESYEGLSETELKAIVSLVKEKIDKESDIMIKKREVEARKNFEELLGKNTK